VYATIGSVFPRVDTWISERGDLLLVASPQPMEAGALRLKLTREPYRSAFRNTWRVDSLEGVLSHFLATDALATDVAGSGTALNTDDRTLIEFGFARTVGSENRFRMRDLNEFAARHGMVRPQVRGDIDWQKLALERAAISYIEPAGPSPAEGAHHSAARHYEDGELPEAFSAWRAAAAQPVDPGELSRAAEMLANDGREDAVPLIERLRAVEPTEADALLARLRLRQRRFAEATDLLVRALAAYRADPWPDIDLMGRALSNAVDIARFGNDRGLGLLLYDALSKPFAVHSWNEARKYYRVLIARAIDGCGPLTLQSLKDLEPNTPWRAESLRARSECYGQTRDALASRAAADLAAFLRNEAEPFEPVSPRPR
jgi:spermidine synthase